MSLLSLFLQPFRKLHLPPPDSFASQTVIVTGANTGLGLEVARHIVTLGATKVILGVRSVAKGEAAKKDIEATTGRSNVVDVWELDLERFDSVKSFVDRASKLPRLDSAIMNAGVATGEWKLSPDGWEQTIQVNVLSTSLLSLLLLPMLAKTGKEYPTTKPHLVIVGSDNHAVAKFEEWTAENSLNALNDHDLWKKSSEKNPVERYSVSKLLDSYLAIELASLVPMVNEEPAVIVDVVTPGLTKSELLTREPGIPFIFTVLLSLTGRTTVEGSKAIVDAAFRGNEAHGKYLAHQRITTPDATVTSDEGVSMRKKVWPEIIQVLSTTSPEVGRIISGDL